ncbi:hypothetical protein Emed_006081 [Eimeria media]
MTCSSGDATAAIAAAAAAFAAAELLLSGVQLPHVKRPLVCPCDAEGRKQLLLLARLRQRLLLVLVLLLLLLCVRASHKDSPSMCSSRLRPQGPKETLEAARAAAIGAAAAALLLLLLLLLLHLQQQSQTDMRRQQRRCGLAAAAAAAVLSVLSFPAADGFAVDSVPAFLVASTLQPASSPMGPPKRGAPLTAAVGGVSEGAFLRSPPLAAAAAAAAADKAAAAAADEEDSVGSGDTVTKKELIERVAVELSLPRSQVEKTVSLFNTFIQQDLSAGKRVYVSKLGTFGLRRRGPRTARNPKTGAPLEAPAATFPSFSFSRNVKEAVRDTVPLIEDAEDTPPPHQTHQHRPQQHHTKKDSKLFGWLP